MSKNEVSADTVQSIWKFFASLRLTIVLLLSLAVTSIIGTLIPQNESPADYFRAYGEFVYRLFDVLDLFDMYHSWWFQVLMVLLTVNVLVCSVDRLSVTWRIIFAKDPRYSVDRFRRRQNRIEFSADVLPGQIRQTVFKEAGRGFGRAQVQEEGKKGFVFFAERWRWSRLGVYIVHGSVILLLIGGLIGSMFGLEGFVNIPEGETVNTIRLRNSNQTAVLPFSVRCDDFSVTFYASGEPKEFRSSLTIIEDGKPVLQKNVIVNDPLRYRGINFFQSSYGEMKEPMQPRRAQPPTGAVLIFTSRESGMAYEQKLAIGDSVQIPEGGGTFRLESYEPEADFMGQPIGEAFKGTLTPPEGEPVEVLLPLRFSNFDKMRKGATIISVAAVEPEAAKVSPPEKRYYTGLQVTKDPGVWIVYVGFILMIVGCFVTFFMSHQQICVEVVAEGEGSRLFLAGAASRNRHSLELRLERIAGRLKESLDPLER
ncbi:MAG: cytochrome c biogenesis protein ResB [Desulfobacterales bacterium]|jgi:cytochrome c biogenesis protein